MAKPGQEETIKVLQLAVQMEKDGKAFYLKSGREAGHELGRKLFNTLAGEEDIHLRKFEEIYEAIQKKNAWPVTDFKPDKGRTIKTIFAQAFKDTGKAASSEMDAIQVAIGMEAKSYDLYKGRVPNAASAAEKDFFETIAAEERGHHLALLDYQEYLKDPAGYFVVKEHHSLDGG